MRAIEQESSVVTPQHRKAAFTRIGLKRGLDNRRDELLLVHHEPNRAGTPQHIDADQEPSNVNVLILLQLAQQHGVVDNNDSWLNNHINDTKKDPIW